MLYKANDRKDVNALYDRLCEHNHVEVLTAVYMLRLMRIGTGWNGLMLWLVKKSRGEQGVRNFFTSLRTLHADAFNSLVVDTVYHCAWGQDGVDQDSVGGWSQREIDLLCRKLGWME